MREIGKSFTDQVRVSISLKEDYSEPAVFHVAADGSVKEITGSINGDVISFTALSEGYYVTANHFASAAGIVICLSYLPDFFEEKIVQIITE